MSWEEEEAAAAAGTAWGQQMGHDRSALSIV